MVSLMMIVLSPVHRMCCLRWCFAVTSSILARLRGHAGTRGTKLVNTHALYRGRSAGSHPATKFWGVGGWGEEGEAQQVSGRIIACKLRRALGRVFEKFLDAFRLL